MDNNNLIKKGLTVGVIFLFFGVAFAPIINANLGKDSKLVEFTTEICALNSVKQTVKLTKEQAEQVEELFDSIRKQLNESNSREETVEILNGAIMELNKYGLLGGLSVKQARRLITGVYQNQKASKFFEKMYNSYQTTIEENENRFCLIAGKTTNTYFEGRMTWFCWSFILWILENQLKIIPIFLVFIFLIFFAFGIWLDVKSPIARGHRIGLGAREVISNISVNTTGWVHTIGLNDVKKWNGSLQGDLSPRVRFCSYLKPGLYIVYQGVYGFRGLKIGINNMESIFYLGVAIQVKINPDPLKF